MTNAHTYLLIHTQLLTHSQTPSHSTSQTSFHTFLHNHSQHSHTLGQWFFQCLGAVRMYLCYPRYPPSQHILSTYPLSTYQHTLSTHHVNTPSKHTLSTHHVYIPFNTSFNAYQHNLSTYSLNAPLIAFSQHPLNIPLSTPPPMHSLNTPSQHTFPFNTLTTPPFSTLYQYPLTTPPLNTPLHPHRSTHSPMKRPKK